MIEAYILTVPAIAWLEGPLVDVFTNAFIQALGASLQNQTRDLVSVVILDVQTNLEESEAVKANEALLEAQESGDVNAIKKANSDFDTALETPYCIVMAQLTVLAISLWLLSGCNHITLHDETLYALKPQGLGALEAHWLTSVEQDLSEETFQALRSEARVGL